MFKNRSERGASSVGNKYFCWNIDDGLEQDKKITEYLRKCGMGATFNLNSGIMGKLQMIGRIGDMGVKDIPIENYKPGGFHPIMRFHEEFRIPADEVCQVYEGFEVASHGLHHENLKAIGDEMARQTILEDVKNLSNMFGTPIIGFAYAFGASTDAAVLALKEAGVKYARSVSKAKDFHRPQDLYHMPMTAWHNEKKVFDKIHAFLEADAADEDLFFLMFAHGYEFDFGTPTSNWEKFQRICDLVAGRDDVKCTSTAEGLGLL